MCPLPCLSEVSPKADLKTASTTVVINYATNCPSPSATGIQRDQLMMMKIIIMIIIIMIIIIIIIIIMIIIIITTTINNNDNNNNNNNYDEMIAFIDAFPCKTRSAALNK